MSHRADLPRRRGSSALHCPGIPRYLLAFRQTDTFQVIVVEAIPVTVTASVFAVSVNVGTVIESGLNARPPAATLSVELVLLRL